MLAEIYLILGNFNLSAKTLQQTSQDYRTAENVLEKLQFFFLFFSLAWDTGLNKPATKTTLRYCVL